MKTGLAAATTIKTLETLVESVAELRSEVKALAAQQAALIQALRKVYNGNDKSKS